MHPSITEQLTSQHARELNWRGSQLLLAEEAKRSPRNGAARWAWFRAQLSIRRGQPIAAVVPLVRKEA